MEDQKNVSLDLEKVVLILFLVAVFACNIRIRIEPLNYETDQMQSDSLFQKMEDTATYEGKNLQKMRVHGDTIIKSN